MQKQRKAYMVGKKLHVSRNNLPDFSKMIDFTLCDP